MTLMAITSIYCADASLHPAYTVLLAPYGHLFATASLLSNVT